MTPNLPEPLPEEWIVARAPGGRYGVVSQPGSSELFAYDFELEELGSPLDPVALAGIPPEDLWEAVFPSSDGAHVAVVRHPLPAQDQPPSPDEVVLFFMKSGVVTRRWRLRELTPEPPALVRLKDGGWRWLALAVHHHEDPRKLVMETWSCWWLTFDIASGDLLDDYKED